MENREEIRKAIKYITFHCLPANESINLHKYVMMAISALEKQEHDRWIPVSKDLPKKDGDYLVTFESGYAEDYGLDPIGIAPFEVDCEGFGIWQESFDPHTLGSLGSDWVEIKVTAWKPLPEHYTAEEES